MRYLLLIFILYCLNTTYAQIPIGYVNFVDFNKGADRAVSIQKTPVGFLITGDGLGTADNNFDFPGKLESLMLNDSGSIIQKYEYGIDSVALWGGLPGSIIRLSDTVFLLPGSYRQQLGSDDIDPDFIYFNPQGDTIKTVRWRHAGKWSIPHQGVITSDNKLLITGAYDNATGNDMKTVVYKTDLDLNIEWQKFYNAPGYDEGYEIVELPDSSFLFGSGQGNFSTLYQGRLLNIDKNGSLQWQKKYGQSGLNCGVAYLNIVEGKLYGAHCLDTLINAGDEERAWYVFQSDLNGNIQWRLFFNKPDYVSPWNFKKASDSTFLLIGQYMYGGMTSHLPDVGYAAMVNTGGHLLWERIYEFDTMPDFYGILHDFVVTEDDGFLFVGQGGDDPVRNSDFWIMKTDSLGCLTPGCDTLHTGTASAPPAFSDHLLKVYPNPASHQLQIQLELSRPANKITATLYNLQGQAVETISGKGWRLLESMEVKPLSAGMYLLKCTADGKEVATEKVVVE